MSALLAFLLFNRVDFEGHWHSLDGLINSHNKGMPCLLRASFSIADHHACIVCCFKPTLLGHLSLKGSKTN